VFLTSVNGTESALLIYATFEARSGELVVGDVIEDLSVPPLETSLTSVKGADSALLK